MKDGFGREIDYMRLSVTDRCNLRCRYCMPEDIRLSDMGAILTYEEIAEVVRASVGLGIRHFRLTGGEPLVRRGVEDLAAMLCGEKGVESVTITTNGVLLAGKARALKEAGIGGINVSLDTLDGEAFARLCGRAALNEVLDGIGAALREGIPVKLNTVVRDGLDFRPIVEYAEKQRIPVRFIEMMPVGYGTVQENGSNEALLEAMEDLYGKATALGTGGLGDGPAVYYRFEGLGQPVGFISAIHGKFCSGCNRVRLTSEGFLKLCLCYSDGADLRAVLRGSHPEGLRAAMEEAIRRKPRAHCFGEREGPEKMAMARIGG